MTRTRKAQPLWSLANSGNAIRVIVVLVVCSDAFSGTASRVCIMAAKLSLLVLLPPRCRVTGSKLPLAVLAAYMSSTAKSKSRPEFYQWPVPGEMLTSLSTFSFLSARPACSALLSLV